MALTLSKQFMRMISQNPNENQTGVSLWTLADVERAQAKQRELAQLQQATDEQEKSGADQEWYRTMLLRVRMGMFAPLNMGPQPGPPDGQMPPPPPHGLPGQPPNPGEVQMPVQVPMQEQH